MLKISSDPNPDEEVEVMILDKKCISGGTLLKIYVKTYLMLACFSPLYLSRMFQRTAN